MLGSTSADPTSFGLSQGEEPTFPEASQAGYMLFTIPPLVLIASVTGKAPGSAV